MYEKYLLHMAVNLVGWQNLTDKGIRVLGDSGSSWQSLSLYACTNVADEGIGAGKGFCCSLRSLYLTAFNQVTDLGFSRLGEGCNTIFRIKLEMRNDEWLSKSYLP